MGFWRAILYIKHRTIRLSDTSHKIAIGLACGTAVSFSPLLGTHFIQAGLFTWLLRGNILAGLIGTFVGNPWTLPFVWWGSVEFGAMIISVFGLSAQTLPAEVNLSVLWELITHEPLRIFLPWMLGGYILGFISFFPFYILFYYLVRGAKIARSKARLRKVHKIAREVTGQTE